MSTDRPIYDSPKSGCGVAALAAAGFVVYFVAGAPLAAMSNGKALFGYLPVALGAAIILCRSPRWRGLGIGIFIGLGLSLLLLAICGGLVLKV